MWSHNRTGYLNKRRKVMSKGMIRAILIAGIFQLSVAVVWAADIWKVEDEDGNVIYTDQPPKDGSKPMDLPELSVIETDFQEQQTPANGPGSTGEENSKELTSGELRKVYRDFQITRPLQEETFWGTANMVMVTWSSSTPFTQDLSIRLFVDGKAQAAPLAGGVSLALDRGEHRVFAELRDSRNRRIAKTGTVTFFIKQNSSNFNRPRPATSGGSG
jgi:hypothetical protein